MNNDTGKKKVTRMNRLTKRGRFGTALVDKNMPRIALVMEEYQDYYIVNKTDYGVVFDRLAAYEDLGLTPNEIKEIIAQRDRLKRTFEGDGSEG